MIPLHSLFRKARAALALFALAMLAATTPAAAEAVIDGAHPLPQPKPGRGRRPAKQLFGAQAFPAKLPPKSFGFYSKGCLAGAEQLEPDGPAWQVMRLSRNRNWGHPALVAYIRRLATEAKEHDGWPGLLVGDLAQPRGGPMLSGHASHQIGLDGDIWLTPAPNRKLTLKEREEISATSMLKSRTEVNRKVWTDKHARLIRRAASYPEVARIFINPAIKKALCQWAEGGDRSWLRKVRPWFLHHYHFHVRIRCPRSDKNCRDQRPPPPGDGCGAELAAWFKVLPKPKKPVKRKPVKPKPPMPLSALPRECRAVLDAE